MPLTNAQYDQVHRIYERRQLEHQRTRNDRLAEIRTRLPEYASLEKEESALQLRKADCLFSGNSTLASDISEQIELLRAKKTNLLTRNGYPEDYLMAQYDCPKCKDTGYIDGQKCQCFSQACISLLYEQSGLRQQLQHDNFSNLSYEYYQGEDLTRFQNAVETCHNFVKNFNSDYRNLFFYGTVGTGKSFLSGCIAKELIEKGNLVLYFSSGKLFNELSRNSFNYSGREELTALQNDLYHSDLLIIDDLGTEMTNSFVLSQLFSLLNERHLLHKSTVISTNLSLQELQDRYSDRVFSRITSGYELCKLTGRDIRMYQKQLLSRK